MKRYAVKNNLFANVTTVACVVERSYRHMEQEEV